MGVVVPYEELVPLKQACWMVDDNGVVLVGLVPFDHIGIGLPYDYPSSLRNLVALSVALAAVELAEYDVVALIVAAPSVFVVWPGWNCAVPNVPFPKILCLDIAFAASLQELRASLNDVEAVVQMTFDARSFDVLPSCCCSVGNHKLEVVENDSFEVEPVLAHQVEPY